MQLTLKIEQAIHKSAILHDGQYRKGEDKSPYITHPFSVALIVSQYTENENIIIAGLLHDTIEDTNYTAEEMEHDFGTEIKNIVLGVTEMKIKNGQKLKWKERKQEYINKLKKAQIESLMVSAADKWHNLSSMIREMELKGALMWEVFIPGPEAQLWFYGEVLKVLKARLEDEIVKELEVIYKKAQKVF